MRNEQNTSKMIGKKPIATTCKCGKSIELKWNGSWHNHDCECGYNVRIKGSNMIIDKIESVSTK